MPWEGGQELGVTLGTKALGTRSALLHSPLSARPSSVCVGSSEVTGSGKNGFQLGFLSWPRQAEPWSSVGRTEGTAVRREAGIEGPRLPPPPTHTHRAVLLSLYTLDFHLRLKKKNGI